MDRVTKRRKNNHIKTKFGININQYQLMLQEQNNVCYICNTKDKSSLLAVDHCHTTNKVRGLLCRNCNAGLGRFLDRVDLLEKAIEYLRREYVVPDSRDFDEYISPAKRS